MRPRPSQAVVPVRVVSASLWLMHGDSMVAPHLSQSILARRSEYYSHLQRMYDRPDEGYTAWSYCILEQ